VVLCMDQNSDPYKFAVVDYNDMDSLGNSPFQVRANSL
jgi:hypothetical protein